MLKKMVVMMLVVLMVSLFVGCGGYQTDLIGPSLTFKYIPKGENANQEYLSRGSGMQGGSTYAAGGGAGHFASTGNGESGSWSWGNVK